ncbi:MAG: chemotaxis protein CheC [Deltaproteobacteria bacterium]|nr:chemotaxis protein CheC [Deltaproteobacteria bacterium]
MERNLTSTKDHNGGAQKSPDIDPQTYGQYFVRRIDFFGLGIAELMPRACIGSECADAKFFVTLQVSGDEQGLCVAAFSRLPGEDDENSMFLELANILASKFVTQFADANCCDITVSPPTPVVAGEQKHRYLTSLFLAAGPQEAFVRRYEYSGTPKVSIRLAYMPSRNSGAT